MDLVDTNVISEWRKARSARMDPRVRQWTERVSPAGLYMSAISVLELETGILLLERRDPRQGLALRIWLETQALPFFLPGRILPVDAAVARRCAALHIPDPKADRDALIAATALVHGLRLVTRNTRDFASMGVELFNPWEYQAP